MKQHRLILDGSRATPRARATRRRQTILASRLDFVGIVLAIFAVVAPSCAGAGADMADRTFEFMHKIRLPDGDALKALYKMSNGLPKAGSCSTPDNAVCAKATPNVVVSDGVALFRETETAVRLENLGTEDVVVHGWSTDSSWWYLNDFEPGERIEPGKKRAYDARFNPQQVGQFRNTLLFNTSAGPLVQLLTSTVYRSPYEFTALQESVPFDVPVEYDLVMYNPTAASVAILSAFTTTPEVTLEPALFEISEESVRSQKVINEADRVSQVGKWDLLPGERAPILRLRVLIRKDEFAGTDDKRTSIKGTVVLNITSESALMRIPFTVTPQRDLIYVVEKHFEFKDLASARDKSTKYLHIFNARKTPIEIRSVFTEDMDRELSIKFGKGTIVPSLTTMRVARITRTGSVEGNFHGVIRVHTNISSALLRVPYSAQVVHGSLTYDADQLIFQAPVGPFGDAVPTDSHIVKRKIQIKNTFTQAVKLRSWKLPVEDIISTGAQIVPLTHINEEVVSAGQSFTVEIEYRPKSFLTAMATTLSLLHNNTSTGTKIPVIVYSGELTVSSTVDFGVVGVGLKRKMRVKFTNHNPVVVEVNTMIIKGTRSVTGSMFSLNADASYRDVDVDVDEVFAIDDCIERSGSTCTQVVQGKLEPGATLDLQLTAAPTELEKLEKEGAELALTTSLGVKTATRLRLVSTDGKVFSEDGEIEVTVPVTELIQKDLIPIRREVMVHSTHGIPVAVSGNLETESDFLEFESIVDSTVHAGESSSIGVITFDTTRQRNELSHFAETARLKSWSNRFKKYKGAIEEDYLEEPISKVDVRRLEKLHRSMKRLEEDGALTASGRVIFSSEAQNGHHTVEVRAKITFPRFLDVTSEDVNVLGTSEHVVIATKDVPTVISVKNPSTTRVLCLRVLPILTNSAPSRRWNGRQTQTLEQSLFQTNIRAARAYASVYENGLRQTSVDPGFVPNYKIDRGGVCLRPEQQIDVLSTVFDPRSRQTTYKAAVCIKNDDTLLECIELIGYSGTSVVETETPMSTSIYVRVVLALACIVVVYGTASRREIDSPAGSPRDAVQDEMFRRSAQEPCSVDDEDAEKATVDRIGEMIHGESSSSEAEREQIVDEPELEEPVSVAATQQSDDSALINHELTAVEKHKPPVDRILVQEPNRRKGKKENETTPRKKEKAETGRDKAKGSRSETDQKQRRARDKKSQQRVEAEKTQNVVTKPLGPVRLAPRSVFRKKTLSVASSDKATSHAGERGSPQAHFDMYNTMFSEAIGDDSYARRSEQGTPPGSVREYTTPPHSRPSSVRNYDMWAAPASSRGNGDMWSGDARSTTGLHSSNLFSFPSDGDGVRASTSLRDSEPFSPQSSTRSGWQSMLSQWEEREDRDEKSKSRSRDDSFSHS